MKFIFTADLHIKLNAKNIPKDWQTNRFKELFKQLNALAEKESAGFIVIGGDIFDKMPTLEELGLYFDLISTLKVRTIIYDGNHEATKKGKTFLSLLKEASAAINPNVEIIDTVTTIDNFTILPYCQLKQVAKYGGLHPTDMLLTHVRGNIEPFVKAEVPLEIFDEWPIVFAGDLHNHADSQRNIVYPGAPMSVSFHRNKVKGGVLLVESTTGSWEWVELKLPQLLRKTVSDPSEMLPDDFDHVIYELVGNSADLAHIDIDTDLLDKKVAVRKTSATLDLKNISIKEELVIYLKEIISLEKEQIDDVIRIFDDYIPNTEIL